MRKTKYPKSPVMLLSKTNYKSNYSPCRRYVCAPTYAQMTCFKMYYIIATIPNEEWLEKGEKSVGERWFHCSTRDI